MIKESTVQFDKFLDQCCVIGEDLSVSSSDLRNAYIKWCSQQDPKVTPYHETTFGDAMRIRGFYATHKGTRASRTGLALRDDIVVDNTNTYVQKPDRRGRPFGQRMVGRRVAAILSERLGKTVNPEY